MLKVTNDLLLTLDSGNAIQILVDLSAVFDTVHHNILLTHLEHLTSTVLHWFTSYITHRTFSVL